MKRFWLLFLLLPLAAGLALIWWPGSSSKSESAVTLVAPAVTSAAAPAPAKPVASVAEVETSGMRVVRFAEQEAQPYQAAAWPALPGPDAPVLTIFETLRARAEQGDAGAACRLAVELDQCRTLQENRLSIERGELGDNPLVGALQLVKTSEERSERARFLLNRCSGLTDRHFESEYDLLKRAALAGHGGSLARFLSGELFNVDLGHNIDHLEDYRNEAPRMLEAALAQGNLSALNTLVNRSASADVIAPDAVRDDPVQAASLKHLREMVFQAMQRESSQTVRIAPDKPNDLTSKSDQAAAEALAAQRFEDWFVKTGSMMTIRQSFEKKRDLSELIDMNSQCTDDYGAPVDPKSQVHW